MAMGGAEIHNNKTARSLRRKSAEPSATRLPAHAAVTTRALVDCDEARR